MGWGNGSRIARWLTILLVFGVAEAGWGQVRSSAMSVVRGQVVDSVGTLLGGVRVWLYRAAPDDSFYSLTSVAAGETVAKADGSFSFRVPPGEYTLQLATPRDQTARWVAEPVLVQLAPGQTVDSNLVARNGGLWEITVADDVTNRPLARARVTIRERASVGNEISAASEADGVARMRLLPGQYEIQNVRCDGYAYDGKRRTATIEEDRTQRVALILTPNVRGVVRDPAGLPVAGARVRIVGAGRQEVTSDEQGQFEIAWDRQFQFRDALTFCLVAQQDRRNLATTMSIGREATALDVRLQACPALAGRLTDPNGQGLAEAWVYVTLRVPNWGDTPLSEEVTQTGPDGRFEIRAVPATGQCTLHASADSYGSRDTAVPIKTVDGLSFDVGTLALPRANLSVSGRVVDTGGRPVPNAMIYGWGDGQPVKLDTQTDALGQFALDHVCPGKVNLRVDAHLGRGKYVRVRVLTDAGASGVEVTSRDSASQWSRK